VEIKMTAHNNSHHVFSQWHAGWRALCSVNYLTGIAAGQIVNVVKRDRADRHLQIAKADNVPYDTLFFAVAGLAACTVINPVLCVSGGVAVAIGTVSGVVADAFPDRRLHQRFTAVRAGYELARR
jgi:hypothetical protein